MKKEASKYLEIFKDHPYIFNLGHGILPETNPEMVENLIKIVKDFKCNKGFDSSNKKMAQMYLFTILQFKWMDLKL